MTEEALRQLAQQLLPYIEEYVRKIMEIERGGGGGQAAPPATEAEGYPMPQEGPMPREMG